MKDHIDPVVVQKMIEHGDTPVKVSYRYVEGPKDEWFSAGEAPFGVLTPELDIPTDEWLYLYWHWDEGDCHLAVHTKVCLPPQEPVQVVNLLPARLASRPSWTEGFDRFYNNMVREKET